MRDVGKRIWQALRSATFLSGLPKNISLRAAPGLTSDQRARVAAMRFAGATRPARTRQAQARTPHPRPAHHHPRGFSSTPPANAADAYAPNRFALETDDHTRVEQSWQRSAGLSGPWRGAKSAFKAICRAARVPETTRPAPVFAERFAWISGVAARAPYLARLARNRAVALGVFGALMASGYSVHASLSDPSASVVDATPLLYIGIESGYARIDVNAKGYNLATPNYSKDGPFGERAPTGSFLFGAANMVTLGGGASLRGEIELQRHGRPNALAPVCCGANPLTMFDATGIDTTSAFANLWLDLPLPFDHTTLFLGGGLGLAYHRGAGALTSFAHDDGHAAFGYHIGGGIAHALTPEVDLVVAGRYRDLGRSRLTNERHVHHAGFEARIGVRYKLEALMPRR